MKRDDFGSSPVLVSSPKPVPGLVFASASVSLVVPDLPANCEELFQLLIALDFTRLGMDSTGVRAVRIPRFPQTF